MVSDSDVKTRRRGNEEQFSVYSVVVRERNRIIIIMDKITRREESRRMSDWVAKPSQRRLTLLVELLYRRRAQSSNANMTAAVAVCLYGSLD